ncbi:E3 ubiquitin-protein ligase RNF12 [Elysia marginata]|uniref:E3 ubiquitin-protein ligase RNF12 n=1 Tax=Elysia marginata TaxID=1093978 RepID=A0AAV4IFC9_9GAST|nr:E3 ubiquitin-protein ligase RNF12 [Elysia marginata]
MASVAPPSVSNEITRSFSKPCSDHSFEDSLQDPMLDIFGNPIFSGSYEENADMLSQSWCCVSEAKFQAEAEAAVQQVASRQCDSLGSVSSNEQSFQQEQSSSSEPSVAKFSRQNNATKDHTPHDQVSPSITPTPKPLDARPKIFDHSKCKKRIKSREREKMKKEQCVEKVDFSYDEQVTANAKSRSKKKKVRTKSTKKWKPVDMTELGFNFSLVPQLDIDGYQSEAGNSNAANNLPSESAHDSGNSRTQCDDAEFFLSLGIDVYADYDKPDGDHLIDWDGVEFSSQSLKTVDGPSSRSHGKYRIRKDQLKSSKKESKTVQTEAKSKTVQASKKPVSKHLQCSTYLTDNTIKKCDKYSLYELECSSRKKVYIRRDRHRRVEKAHKAVKSKNFVSFCNNRGRKRLYMHHRLVKMHALCLDFRSTARRMPLPPIPKTKVDLNAAKQIFKVNHNPGRVAEARGSAPAQNLRHTLHESNAPNHLALDLASFLISLQHREMTPEDYEMLLRLDDTVKPKTVSENVLEKLKTETVGPGGVGAENDVVLCAICMDPYVAGDTRKFLPCGHDFHATCVDTWLKNSSMNCPLDGLPVETS